MSLSYNIIKRKKKSVKHKGETLYCPERSDISSGCKQTFSGKEYQMFEGEKNAENTLK